MCLDLNGMFLGYEQMTNENIFFDNSVLILLYITPE